MGSTASAPTAPSPAAGAQGVLHLASRHSVADTVERIRAAVTSKGILFFTVIDQQQLGMSAGLAIPSSVLVVFGNPPLGVQFIQSNPYAGLDWPVRMLVRDTGAGTEIAWTDFAFVGQRYGLADRQPQLAMAAEVAAGIAQEAGN